MKTLILVLSLSLVLVSTAICRAEPTADDYLVNHGRRRVQLKNEIAFREIQGGAAGEVGRAWRINEIGEWVSYPFRYEMGLEIAYWSRAKTGRLAEEDLLAIANLLSTIDFFHIPAKSPEGYQKKINPHYFIVSFGESNKELHAVASHSRNTISENIRTDASESIIKADKEKFASLAEIIADRLKDKI